MNEELNLSDMNWCKRTIESLCQQLASAQERIEGVKEQRDIERAAYLNEFEKNQVIVAENARLRQQLTNTCDWFDAQAKSNSKGNQSAWDLMILREERDAINKVLRELK